MVKQNKIPTVTLDDATACRLIFDRAQRENRSRRNALITTVLEALGHNSIIDTNYQGGNRRGFRDGIIEKSGGSNGVEG